MKKIEELHFRVVDKGLFVPVARRLARDAGKVSYWSPCDKPFPTVRDCIGDGFHDIERVSCFLEDKNSVDCWVFPDVGFGELQVELERQGFPVWGCRHGGELELSRGKFLDILKQTGLPVPKYEKVKGLTALRERLRDEEDVWVKISGFRGDFETFHWRSRQEDENNLDAYAVRFGPFRELVIFYVFEPINDAIEDGCDSWSVNGRFPAVILHGMEAKDKAFIGTFQKLADLPEEVRAINEAFGPVLARYGYCGFFSSEVRITDEGNFFTDPTCRAGSPPSQVMTEMIGNYADIIWRGAQGECLDPDPAAKFGVQCLIDIHRDVESWTYLALPDDLDRWVKSAQCLGTKGMLAAPPNPDKTGCEDWLVGIGDTLEEAIRHLQRNIKLLPSGVCCSTEGLAELLSQIKDAEEGGMEFTDQPVPEPEIVVAP